MQMTTDLYWHKGFLQMLAARMKPRLYLELGSASGSTICPVAQHCERAIGVDLKPPREDYAQGWEFIQGDTITFLTKTLPDLGQQVDLAFVDSDHECGHVTNELYGLLPYMRPGGLIAIHDTYPEDDSYLVPTKCGTAWLAASMAVKGLEDGPMASPCEVLTLPFPPGLTMIRPLADNCHFHDKRDGTS